ncbi:ChaN family lipoprotein [Noviherbaspirillum sp.]|uniref:ChaN family lipoprotein n=1 Tax=Noviherbaspirillum sp. TaxID=1926288 RepID=UPI0025D7B1D0|nr:ChaN family lipoprotein [Noviherbaspirillum sp.]
MTEIKADAKAMMPGGRLKKLRDAVRTASPYLPEKIERSHPVMQPKNLRTAAIALACLSAFALHSAQAASAPSCLIPSAWTALDRAPFRTVPENELLTDMAKREVVLLGEHHDDDDHHRWQLQTLAALHLLRPNMAIGFEMFPRRVQAVLDRWVAGDLTVKQFLEQAEWNKVWNTPPELYLPLFEFARINRIPMMALNVDSSLNKAVREKGWDSVPEAQREGVGRAAPPSDAYRDFLFDVYRVHAMHAAKGAKNEKASKSDSAFRNFVESQTTWDRAMAEALARRANAVQGSDKPLVVGIMGSGHIRFNYGVPFQLRDLGIKNVGTMMALSSEMDCKEIRPGMVNVAFGLPPQAEPAPEPPRLGVRLEENEGAVRIIDVGAGSLAEKSGLKNGDRLLEVGGAAVNASGAVVAAVRGQPAGTWLPMRIKRGDETLDLIIKFPVRR